MSLLLAGLVVVGAVLLVLALWAVSQRNALSAARDRCERSWSDLEACLRRRHETVDAIVSAVRDSGAGQPTELQVLVDARMAASMASAPYDRAVAERELGAAIARLDERAGHDHRLASGEVAEHLRTLDQLDEDTQIARRIYNVDVRLFLSRKRAFPASLLARGTAFADRAYFELDNTRGGRVTTGDFNRAAA